MEILRNLCQDFILFSLWDGLIFYLFMSKVAKIELKKRDWIYSAIWFSLSSLIPPLFRQLIGIIICAIFIYILRIDKIKINKFLYIIKLIFFEYMFALVCEMAYSSLFNFIGLIDLSKSSNIEIFIFYIPVRITEIGLIILINKKRRTHHNETMGRFRRSS